MIEILVCMHTVDVLREKTIPLRSTPQVTELLGVPTGIRTPVTSVKGRCPRPLDDGDLRQRTVHSQLRKKAQEVLLFILFFLVKTSCTLPVRMPTKDLFQHHTGAESRDYIKTVLAYVPLSKTWRV